MTIPITDDYVDDDILRHAFGELQRRLANLPCAPDRHVQHPVERALAWIEAGVYGRCSVCTEPLSPTQILADPADMTCERCRRTSATTRFREARRAA